LLNTKKLYYSIGEVSKITGLPASVLRFWETEFSGLRPAKNRAGKRVYREVEIDRLLLIKKLLYEERFTIEGARQYLNRSGETAKPDHAGSKLDAQTLPAQEIRRGLQEILGLLK
jgi:DNA-binding transcriptional MerR regulator